MHRYLVVLLPLFVSLAACDGLEPEGHVSQIFVESYQVAEVPLRPVHLTRTSAVDGTYDPADRAIRGADVTVELLRGDGTVEVTYPYREQAAGVYVAEDAEATVHPLRRYRLRAVTPKDETVTATTLVPSALRLVSTSADTVIYQDDDNFEFVVRRGPYPGRQNAYILSIEALAATEANLTPLYRRLLEDDDGGIDAADVAGNRKNEDFPLNEALFEVEGDVVTFPLPWIQVAFYGPLRLAMNALDDNLLDFVRSMRVQHEGGVGNSPGEIGSLLEYVDGGTGVFGSYAKVEAEVYVAR